jgi:hypothetical protein
VLLAFEGMDDRRLQTFGERDDLIMRAGAARSAQQGYATVRVQKRREAIEIALRRDHHGRRRDERLGGGRFGRRLQRDVTRHDQHRDAALRRRLVNRHFQHARHLAGAGDQLAEMAALAEQLLGMGLLEVAGADLG